MDRIQSISSDQNYKKQMRAKAKASGETEISLKKNTVFAESTFNDQCGTGLDKIGTENPKRSEWSGQNLLGQIISNVAQKCVNAK